MKFQALIASAFFLASSAVMAEPVDLSDGWEEDGGGNWVLQDGNLSVLQTLNTPAPAVFFNNENSQGKALSGSIEVQTTSDNDFIGFVLGYNQGDSTNANADYLLVDWKQGNQENNGVDGQKGLAISQVTGAFDFDDFWGHEGVVTELQRAATLGNTGWMDNQNYTFDLVFTANAVQVMVNGKLELNINGNFADGSFGFYNLSQEMVLYAGIEEGEAVLADVPVPAPLALLGLGLLGLGLSRRSKRS